MIEQLTQQIAELTTLNQNYFVLAISSLIGGGIVSFLFVMKYENLGIIYSPIALGVIISLLLILTMNQVYADINELEIQLDNEIKQSYISMSCNDLRHNIISQLTNNNQTMIDFQTDYYFVNCETPLRDEVLKLQKAIGDTT